MVIVFAFGFAACEKYPEGPAFSVMSKKARMTGLWQVVKHDGDSVRDDLTYDLEKDGDITMTYTEGDASFSFDGQWDFTEDKEELITEFGDDVDKFKIIRLKNKEMILLNDDDERIEFEKQDRD